jgi:VWFA-related protein
MTQRMWRVLRFAVGVWLGTVALSAQGQQPSKPAAPAEPGQPPPIFRMRVDLITTDVIVRDSNGQFVADLTKNDFQVLEDGVKQDISSVELVHGGRTFNLQAPPPPPAQEGLILPASKPTNDAAGRVFLFFVDDLHMDFNDTPKIRQLFKKMANTLVHDGDMFGIVSTGTSSISIDMTYDRKRMDEAIAKISGSALKPKEIIEGPTTSEGPSEVRYRAHVAFSTANEICHNLEKVQNRRKAVIFVSNGYDFNPFEGARYADPNVVGTTNNTAQTFRNMGENQYDPFTRQQNEFADAD